MFPIRRVERTAKESLEPLGSKEKYWFRDGDRRLLFKAEDRGTGEDWAEVVSCHLCELLGLPHVEYELAEEWSAGQRIRPGVICENFAPPPKALLLGNQMLALVVDPTYPSAKRRVRQHSVEAISDVLFSLEPPGPPWMKNCPNEIASAIDVFSGYLLLDAWIANQDRHHENWAGVVDDLVRLAPTYDHGAGLARNLTDEERRDRLTTKDRGRSLEAFAVRAKSAIYRDAVADHPLSTLDAFTLFSAKSPTGAAIWKRQLEAIQEEDIQAILNEVPDWRMSPITKEFTMVLLRINKQRILETVTV